MERVVLSILTDDAAALLPLLVDDLPTTGWGKPGSSLLHFTALARAKQCFVLVLKYFRRRRYNIDLEDATGATALHTVANENNPLFFARLLLAYGADVNYRSTMPTALYIATYWQNEKLAICLIQHGAAPFTYNGMSPLNIAIACNNRSLISRLLPTADLNAEHISSVSLAVNKSLLNEQMIDLMSPVYRKLTATNALLNDDLPVLRLVAAESIPPFDIFKTLRLFIETYINKITSIDPSQRPALWAFSQRKLNFRNQIRLAEWLGENLNLLSLLTNGATACYLTVFVQMTNCRNFVLTAYDACVNLYVFQRILPDEVISYTNEFICSKWIRNLFF